MTAADEGVRLEGLIEWRGSRPDMESFDGETGEQVSFIYLPDGSRLAVGGGRDPVEQCAAIIAAHNATLTRLEAEVGRLREALETIANAPAWGARQQEDRREIVAEIKAEILSAIAFARQLEDDSYASEKIAAETMRSIKPLLDALRGLAGETDV